MRKLLVPLACLLLAGCAAKILSSSARTVVIDANSQGIGEVQKLADAECAKHGRHARLVSTPRFGTNEHLFDCVQ